MKFGLLLLIVVTFLARVEPVKKGYTKKVCRELEIRSMADVSYNGYKKAYANCTHIVGNLVISYLNQKDDYDMSFLGSIREVTGYVKLHANHFSYPGLTGLQLIRGETLFLNRFSLHVTSNFHQQKPKLYGLKELRLYSLVEIMEGQVLFSGNLLMCYDSSVEWRDIFRKNTSDIRILAHLPSSKKCGHCHPSCIVEDTQHCWGPGPKDCQKLTQVLKSCSSKCSGRCHGNICCHEECAGGCTGPTEKDCNACASFYDEGRCVPSCPAMAIYQHSSFKWVSNPKGKYSHEHTCISKCPAHLLVDDGVCTKECKANKTEVDRICKPCNGICPKTCNGTGIVHAGNIGTFQNCTIISGSISIINVTFMGDKSKDIGGINVTQLMVFENVQEITGYLVIQHLSDSIKSLSFFNQLRIIHGRELLENRYCLVVYNTHLEKLELNTLRTIMNGVVKIQRNPSLCFVEDFDWNELYPKKRTLLDHSVSHNKPREFCAMESMTCSKECGTRSCWGPNHHQCLSCAAFMADEGCLESCDVTGGFYVSGSESEARCSRCDKECNSTCFGEGAEKCTSCRHVSDGPYCLEKCPYLKYPAENNTCMDCHLNCKLSDGCTGPGGYVGKGGCNSCLVVETKEPFRPGICIDLTKAPCLAPIGDDERPFCRDGFFVHHEKNAKGHGANEICYPCHPECRRCDGPSSFSCDLSTCIRYVEGSQCVANCSGDHYPDDAQGTCRKCHEQCLGCVGPRASDCLSCKKFKVFENFEDPANMSFVCTTSCPSWLPEVIVDSTNDTSESICVTEEYALEHMGHGGKKELIIGLVMGGLIFIVLVLLIVVYLKRQWARSEENKIRISARIRGIEECEPLTPSNAKPDLATMRLIKESELVRGNIIGSGAFGTVYKGAWIPEGENVRIPVAIKVLQEGTSTSQNKELLQEARVMASVEHPCCVRILAVCMAAQLMLVTQLLPLGCLLDYIRKNKCNIGSKALLNWTYQIAKGMKYLEERGIIHRDLAARNVLVQSPSHVKITDFGLSKLLDFNEEAFQVSEGRMPIKWLALECIQHRIFNHKSDVWSFGITMWELYTYGQRPYDNIRAKDISYLLEKGERLPQPIICTIDVYMIMIKCWMLDAQSRPSFKELAEEFAKMARDPGRFLVIPGDKLMRLPNQYYDASELLHGTGVEGPEQAITAEEYLQFYSTSSKRHQALCSGQHKFPNGMTERQNLINTYKSTMHIAPSLMAPKKAHFMANGHHHHHHHHHHQQQQQQQQLNPLVSTASTSSGNSSNPTQAGTPRQSDNPFPHHIRRHHVGHRTPNDSSTRSTTASRYSIDPCKEIDKRKDDLLPLKMVSDYDMKMPLVVDENNYLQPEFSTPSTYLDLIEDENTNESNESNDSQHRTENLTISSESGGISNPEYYEESGETRDGRKAPNVSTGVQTASQTPTSTTVVSNLGKVHPVPSSSANATPSQTNHIQQQQQQQQVHSKRNSSVSSSSSSSFLPFPYHVTQASSLGHSPSTKTVLKVLGAKNENGSNAQSILSISTSNFGSEVAVVAAAAAAAAAADGLLVQKCDNGVVGFQHVATFRSKPGATETNV